MAQNQPAAGIGYVVMSLVTIGLVVFIVRMSHHEVEFCRRVFAGLVNGDSRVCRLVDWDRFKALETDVGAVYRQLPNDTEKSQYQRTFVEHFSKSFRDTGGQFKSFANWRREDTLDGQVVVAADYPSKHSTLLFRVPASWWKKRLFAIQWKQSAERQVYADVRDVAF